MFLPRKSHHRDIYLGLLGVKHNLRTYLRAVALKCFIYFAPTPLSANQQLLRNIDLPFKFQTKK